MSVCECAHVSLHMKLRNIRTLWSWNYGGHNPPNMDAGKRIQIFFQEQLKLLTEATPPSPTLSNLILIQ